MRRGLTIAGLVLLVVLAGLWLSGGLAALEHWLAEAQRAAQGRLAAMVRAVRGGEAGAVAGLIALSFGYGLAHAAGPGHGKVLIGGYGVARRVTALRLSGIALAASLAQAGVAVMLAYGAIGVLGWTRDRLLGGAEAVMVPVSQALIAALGLWLVWRGIRGLRRGAGGAPHEDGGDGGGPHDHAATSAVHQSGGHVHDHVEGGAVLHGDRANASHDLLSGRHVHDHVEGGMALHGHPADASHDHHSGREVHDHIAGGAGLHGHPAASSGHHSDRHLHDLVAGSTGLHDHAANCSSHPHAGGQDHASHSHGPDCGCGHAHAPTAAQVAALSGWRDTLLLIAGIAMRPCSGALFLLILTWQLGIGGAGVAGAFAMGLGTALVTVAAAALSVWAREGAFAALPGQSLGRALPVIEIVAGGLVVFAALTLLRGMA